MFLSSLFKRSQGNVYVYFKNIFIFVCPLKKQFAFTVHINLGEIKQTIARAVRNVCVCWASRVQQFLKIMINSLGEPAKSGLCACVCVSFRMVTLTSLFICGHLGHSGRLLFLLLQAGLSVYWADVILVYGYRCRCCCCCCLDHFTWVSSCDIFHI